MSSGTQKNCGCKGIRSCLLCESNIVWKPTQTHVERYRFCPLCSGAWLESANVCSSHPNHSGTCIDFPGVHIFPDFISSEEEEDIVAAIDQVPWNPSQSGRKKQDYGPKVNFKKRKIRLEGFTGLPPFAEKLVEKFSSIPVLSEFQPAELCNLDYSPERGSSIDPHVDDFWLWGERLVTLNLLSETVLSFTKHDLFSIAQAEALEDYQLENGMSGASARAMPEVRVVLPPRSLLVVMGPARLHWKHGIHREDIVARRLAVTFRELTSEFLPHGEQEATGKEVLALALTFRGMAVGVANSET